MANLRPIKVDEGIEAAVTGDTKCLHTLLLKPLIPFLIGGILAERVFPVEANGGGITGLQSFAPVQSRTALMQPAK